jgi:hypothetical protein
MTTLLPPLPTSRYRQASGSVEPASLVETERLALCMYRLGASRRDPLLRFSLPRDRSALPWHVRISTTAPVRVCVSG